MSALSWGIWIVMLARRSGAIIRLFAWSALPPLISVSLRLRASPMVFSPFPLDVLSGPRSLLFAGPILELPAALPVLAYSRCHQVRGAAAQSVVAEVVWFFPFC